MKKIYALLTALMSIGSAVAAQNGPFSFEFEELAAGVWAGVRPDSPRFPVMGNVTFAISDGGVVVFDGGGAAAMAEQVIAKIRSITDQAVTHVVISHWHGDHHFGIHRYGEEFPNVRFIAQSFTYLAMNGSPIDYIKNYPTFVEKRVPQYQEFIATGKDADGNDVSDHDKLAYEQIVADAEILDVEFQRVRVTLPNVVFDDKLTIHSDERTIELLSLGHGNTEGDIVMWLPRERLVAAGDLVVLPSPYAFNMPPKAWANTLRRLNDLQYATLVPGHGAVQHDTSYVELLIEVAENIVGQRDVMLAEGLSAAEVQTKLDFSSYEEKFTGGDGYVKGYYDDWFEQPLRRAALKELTGQPMQEIGPREASE